MSLITRKARPLKRDVGSLRDDRLFIVACDDTYAPAQYFGFFNLPRIQVHVVAATDNDSHAEQVLARLKQVQHEDDDQLWMLLDTDHCINDEHVKSFSRALQDAKKAGVNVALSRPCFELWLLLHHLEECDLPQVMGLNNARKIEQALSEALGTYNKTRLKQENFPLRKVVSACQLARRLDSEVAGGEIPEQNTTRVYQLWLEMIDKALPSQLPAELLPLKIMQTT